MSIMPTHDRHGLDVPASTSGFTSATDALRETIRNISFNLSPDDPAVRRSLTLVSEIERMFHAVASARPRTAQETRFWAKIVADPPHMIWTGMGGDRPQCDWTMYGGHKIRTTPQRVVWLLRTGHDIPTGTYMRKLCDVPRCVSHECHEPANSTTPTIKRIRKDIILGDNGAVLCARNGHLLQRPPRPGEKLYCSACYQIDARERKRNDAIRRELETGQLRSLPDYRFSDVEPDEAPPVQQNTSPTPLRPPTPRGKLPPEIQARVDALFAQEVDPRG